MLDALAFFHSKNIVHRDLKPENLILANKNDDYNVMIADFGLATYCPKDDVLSLRCGSPGYVAPELLKDEGYNMSADVYSVGVILHVLLCGRPAFRGYNVTDILKVNREGLINFKSKAWEKVSPEGLDLVQKMLTKDPKERISAAEALKHPWFHQEEKKVNNQNLEFNEGIKEVIEQ